MLTRCNDIDDSTGLHTVTEHIIAYPINSIRTSDIFGEYVLIL